MFPGTERLNQNSMFNNWISTHSLNHSFDIQEFLGPTEIKNVWKSVFFCGFWSIQSSLCMSMVVTRLIKIIGNQTFPLEQKSMAFVSEIRSESFFLQLLLSRTIFGGKLGYLGLRIVSEPSQHSSWRVLWVCHLITSAYGTPPSLKQLVKKK